MSESMFTKFGMYITASEPISTAYFISTSHQSLCLYVYSSYRLLSNGSVNTFRRQRRIVEGVFFYAVRVVSKGNKRFLNRTSCSVSFLRVILLNSQHPDYITMNGRLNGETERTQKETVVI
jgi:hypothetical protein